MLAALIVGFILVVFIGSIGLVSGINGEESQEEPSSPKEETGYNPFPKKSSLTIQPKS